jgi:hypothetical protein
MFKDLFIKLETAENPVALAIQKTATTKAVAIAFKKGMILKEHKTEVPALLLVVKGSVLYKEHNMEEQILIYHEKNIPTDILHSLEALEDSLCILFKG